MLCWIKKRFLTVQTRIKATGTNRGEEKTLGCLQNTEEEKEEERQGESV